MQKNSRAFGNLPVQTKYQSVKSYVRLLASLRARASVHEGWDKILALVFPFDKNYQPIPYFEVFGYEERLDHWKEWIKDSDLIDKYQKFNDLQPIPGETQETIDLIKKAFFKIYKRHNDCRMYKLFKTTPPQYSMEELTEIDKICYKLMFAIDDEKAITIPEYRKNDKSDNSKERNELIEKQKKAFEYTDSLAISLDMAATWSR